MLTPKEERNKDVIHLQRLCKDLFKFIKKKIIKYYVLNDISKVSPYMDINEEKPSIWQYFKTSEKVTESDKVLNIFKDNSFLPKLQKFYEVLEIVIFSLDENRKKYESMKKRLKCEIKNMKFLSDLKPVFNPYFIYPNPIQKNFQYSNVNNIIKNIYFARSFNYLQNLNSMNSSKPLNLNEISYNVNNSIEKYINLKNKRENENDKNINLKDKNINAKKEKIDSFNENMQNNKDEVNQNSIIELIDRVKIPNGILYNKNYINSINNLNKKNFISINNLNNNKIISKDNPEIEFEKLLRNEFSSIYCDKNCSEICKDIILELEKILKIISQIKFPEFVNKIEDPILIGTFKYFKPEYLLNYLPNIDILFKCKDIKSIDEINSISKEILSQKLSLNYTEEKREYDKESEIVMVTNKCQIMIKGLNYLWINITLFFVNINISSYNKKEQCITRYMSLNEIYNNKDKILICLFFRRWRRKNKLFFIWPEFLDIIINHYFNENDKILKIIENIFTDLLNEKINIIEKNNNNEDKENINEILEFIKEWYNYRENKASLINAITSTKECLEKKNWLSVVKNDYPK